MGSCTRRHFLLSICVLQMLSTFERQIFDFLGYMWAPILVNFFHIIFVIFGFFGAYQYRPKYLVTYSLWNLLWIAWNSFLICFYLNIGLLDRDGDLLNLGTGSVSWFEVNGYGCKPTYPINITSEDPYRLVRPEKVEGCFLEYHIIEIIHSMVQNMFAILGLIAAICIGQTFLEEDDSFDFMGSDAKSPQHTAVHPMYVSYSSLPTTNSATTTHKLILNQSKSNLLNNSNNNIKYDVFKVNNNSNSNTIIDTNTIISSSSTSSAKKLVTVDHPPQNNTTPLSNKIHHSQSQHCYPLPSQQQVPQQSCPQHHPISRHSSFNNKQNRKNSNNSVRYTDMVQVVPRRSCPSPPPPPIPQHPHRQIVDEEFQAAVNDECYFIPKSTSTQRSNQNFGVQNPFNRQIILDRRFVVAEEDTSDHTVDDDDDNSLFALNAQPLGSTTPLKKVNTPATRHHFQRNNPYKPVYRNRLAMDAANKLLQIPTPPQHLIEEEENSFKMPYQHALTRSPNLNRISRRSNMSNSSSNSNFLQKSQHANFCDQIRDAPPGYMDPPAPQLAMHRAKSQDRLAQRSSRRGPPEGANGGGRFNQSNQQRPRSFCSNVFPDFVQE